MEHAFLHPNSGHGCKVMASIGASRYLVSGNVLVGKACTCQSIQLGHNLESWQDKYLHETAPLPSLWNRVRSVRLLLLVSEPDPSHVGGGRVWARPYILTECMGNLRSTARPRVPQLICTLLPITFVKHSWVTQHRTLNLQCLVTGDTEAWRKIISMMSFAITASDCQVNILSWGQLKCKRVPRPFLPVRS